MLSPITLADAIDVKQHALLRPALPARATLRWTALPRRADASLAQNAPEAGMAESGTFDPGQLLMQTTIVEAGTLAVG